MCKILVVTQLNLKSFFLYEIGLIAIWAHCYPQGVASVR